MLSLGLASILLLADAAAPTSPEEVGRLWLHALVRADLPALQRLTGVPFVAEGFQYNERAELNVCDKTPGMKRNPRSREIQVSARSESELKPMFACLLAGIARREWTKDGVEPTLKRLRHARESSRRVARYRQRLVPLLATHTLVQVVRPELDGITLSALLALRPQGTSFVVDAYYLDFLFQE